MLSLEHKLLLANLVLENREVVMGRFSAFLTKTKKQKTWDDIAEKMRDAGADFKDVKDLRDGQWAGIQRGTKAKLDRSRKTGQGKVTELNELDELVLQILGPDSGKLHPIKVSEPIIVFEGLEESVPAKREEEEMEAGTAGTRVEGSSVGQGGDHRGEPEKPEPEPKSVKRKAEVADPKKCADELMGLRKERMLWEKEDQEEEREYKRQYRRLHLAQMEKQMEQMQKQNRLLDLQIQKMEREEREEREKARVANNN